MNKLLLEPENSNIHTKKIEKKFSSFFTNEYIYKNNMLINEEKREAYLDMNNNIHEVNHLNSDSEKLEIKNFNENKSENNLYTKDNPIKNDNISDLSNIKHIQTFQTNTSDQIINCFLNKTLIENDNSHMTFNKNYDSHNFNNNNSNSTKVNLVIPENYNENPNFIKRKKSNKKIIFFIVLFIIFLVLVLGCIFNFFQIFDHNKYVNLRNYKSKYAIFDERKNIIEVLSELEIICPYDTILTRYTLKKFNNNNTVCYDFTCSDIPYLSSFNSTSHISNMVYYDREKVYPIAVLSKLRIECPYNHAVNSFKLNFDKSTDMLFYEYQCLKIENYNYYKVNCDYKSTDTKLVQIKYFDMLGALDLECKDVKYSYNFLNSIKLNYYDTREARNLYYSIDSCNIRKNEK